MTVPTRENCYGVFSQQRDARIDIDTWSEHAVRFFATRIGLTQDRRDEPDEGAPRVSEASFLLSPHGEPAGVRTAFARRCEPEDYALAEQADARAGHTGLALLARRCGLLWLVVREAPSDRLALRLAAIFASIFLGPILDARTEELFGMKTARAKLETETYP